MNRFTFIFTSCIALTASATTAFAQNTAPPEEVSTLNGELVPVGEQHRYKYEYDKWNISTNPIGLITGSYGLSVSHALTANIALRADANYYAPLDSDIDGFELGLGVPLYFRHMNSGFFLEPGAMFRRLEADVDGAEAFTEVGPQILMGWHWNWDSGFNVAIAAGLGRNFSSDDERADVFGNGYLRVGYAF